MSGEGYSGRLWNDDGSEDGRGAEYGADAGAPRREYSPDELADEITLASVDGVGPLTAFRLIEYFGSAGAVLDAHESDLARVEKVGPVLARKIALARSTFDVESLVKFCVANDVAILSLNDTRYPARLLDIATPPRILYVRGELRPEDYHAIAMVGTRTPTPYGRAQATRLAHELVDAGFTVVSGLALGIDGASHRGALDAKGRTIAVLGGGVVRIYPQEHEDLAGRVMNSGALVSEYGPLTSPMRGNFPARNRIISGLAIGVLVVESGEKGGSLITARNALDQNRDVFAVPGRVDAPTSRGCHQLLREGACLVESVDDIIHAIAPYEVPAPRRAPRRAVEDPAPGTLGISNASIATIARPPKKRERGAQENVREPRGAESAPEAPKEERLAPVPENASPDEIKILEIIDGQTLPIDDVARKSGLPVSRALGLIVALEFKGVLTRLEGNAITRRRV